MRLLISVFFLSTTYALAMPEVFLGPLSISIDETAATVPVTIPIELSEPAGGEVSVDYTTVPGTADSGDFSPVSGTFTFSPGSVYGTVDVSILPDSVFEALEESFIFVLTNATGATLGNSQKTINITDTELLDISVTDASVVRPASGEGVSLAFEISSPPVNFLGGIDLAYIVSGLDAFEGSDFTNATGTITLSDSGAPITLEIPVPAAPQIGDRTVYLLLSPPPALENRTFLRRGGAFGTIIGNAGAPIVLATGSTAAEGTAVDFTISLSAAQPSETAVTYSTREGTAAAGSDYTETSGTLTFAAGETSKTVAVPLLDDAVFESNETFYLDLEPTGSSGVATPEKWVAPEQAQLPFPIFGSASAISIDGDSLAVSITSDNLQYKVLLYERAPETGWRFVKTIPVPVWFTNGVGGVHSFGASLSLSGNTLAVGAPKHMPYSRSFPAPAGAVIFFEKDSGGTNNWGQTQIIYAAETADETPQPFGTNIELDGDTLAAAIVADGWPGKDRVQIFGRDTAGGTWSFRQELTGDTPRARFGTATALKGDRIAIGAPQDRGGAGAVFLYARDASGTWLLDETLSPFPQRSTTNFGKSAQLTQDGTIFAGFGADAETLKSGIFGFKQNAGTWEVTSLKFPTAGSSFAASGDLVSTLESTLGNLALGTTSVDLGGDTVQLIEESDLPAGGSTVRFRPEMAASPDTLVVSATGTPFLLFEKAHAAATITDDEAATSAPVIGLSVIGSTTIEEPFSIPRAFEFDVSLSAPFTTEVQVTLAYVTGIATRDEDFTRVESAIIFAPGETSKTVSVAILPDFEREDRQEETFTISIASARPALLNDGNEITITIVDRTPSDTIAVADSYTIPQGVAFIADGSGATPGNESIFTNDAVARFAEIITAPPLGTATIYASRVLEYVPPSQNYIGNETLTYSAKRSSTGVLSPPVEVQISVEDAAVPPSIQDDAYAASRSTGQFSTSILGLPSAYTNEGLLDPSGTAYDPLLEVELSGTDRSKVESFDLASGHFVVDLGPSFRGTLEFTYRVRDKDGWSENSALVRIESKDVPFPASNFRRAIPYAAGITVSHALSDPLPPGSASDFVFDLAAGETVSLLATSSVAEELSLKLIAPGGTAVFSGEFAVSATTRGIASALPTPTTGQYILEIERPQSTSGEDALVDFEIVRGALATQGGANSSSPAHLENTSTTRDQTAVILPGGATGWFHLPVESGTPVSIALWQRGSPGTAAAGVSVFSEAMIEIGSAGVGGSIEIPPTTGTTYLLRTTGSALFTVVKNGMIEGTQINSDTTTIYGHLWPSAATKTFAVLGDYGDAPRERAPDDVAAMIKTWIPDFIVCAGDQNYGQTSIAHPDWEQRIGARYGEFILGRSDARYPLQTSAIQRYFPVVGNHDTDPEDRPLGAFGGGTKRGYLDYFLTDAPGAPLRLPTGQGQHTERASFYDFYQGDIHFIMADSDLGQADDDFARKQNRWIERTLKNSRGRWKFLITHQAAWSSARHGDHEYLHGSHLSLADAIFAAHDHVYERIERDGTLFFTSGLGGRPSYSFRRPFTEGSQVRYNRRNGAMRVVTGGEDTTFEFLSISSSDPGGQIEDTKILSSPISPNPTDRYPLIASAGDVLTLASSSARPIALTLYSPDGSAVASGEGGLTHTTNSTGSYELQVASGSEAEASDYILNFLRTPPTNSGFAGWKEAFFGENSDPLVSGALADAERDGIPVLLEYALGTDPNLADPAPATIARTSTRTTIAFGLAAGFRSDLQYTIEASNDLTADWTPVAERSGGVWTGSLSIAEESSSEILIPDVTSGFRFYRLSVTLKTATQ